MVVRLSIKNRDLYKWCICTAAPSCRGAITALGGTAWTTAFLTPATFLDVSFPTNRCCNKNRKLAGIRSNGAASFSSAVVGYASSIGATVFLISVLMSATLQGGPKKQNILLLSPRGSGFNSKCTSYNLGSIPKLLHFLAHSVEVAEGRGRGNLRYGIRGDSTSLATILCERLILKTWVKMQDLLVYHENWPS